MPTAIHSFLRDERAATSVEYALLASLIMIVIVGAIGAIGTRMNAKFYGPVSAGLS